MKKLLFILTSCLFLLSSNNVFSQEAIVESNGRIIDNTYNPMLMTTSTDQYVRYTIDTDCVKTGGYVTEIIATVTWQYSGPLEKPQIAFIVKLGSIYGGTIAQFQDSANTRTGTRKYNIKSNTGLTQCSINGGVTGSNGGLD